VLSIAFGLQKTCQFIAKMQIVFFGNNFDVLKRWKEQENKRSFDRDFFLFWHE